MKLSSFKYCCNDIQGNPYWDGDKLVIEMKPKDENSTVKPQKQTRYVEGDQLILVSETHECIVNCDVKSIILVSA